MPKEAGSNQTQKIGILVLAAGASVRMGTPKQLLKINGISLIRRAAENALDCGSGPVVVVLGANADRITPELNSLATGIVVNPEWKSGMASSIRCGLTSLLAAHPETTGVILFLADQPKVTGTSLRKLTAAHQHCGAPLVAAFYSGHLGTPALFSQPYFHELLRMEGPGGAKKILEQHATQVLAIDFPEAAVDLDTLQDLADFVQGNHS